MSWVMPRARSVASISAGDRRFQSAGILEAVRVEVEGAREVALRVLLGDAEVHVEEQGLRVVVRLGALAGEQLADPLDVDEAVVVREALDREAVVRSPGREAGLVAEDVVVTELGQSRVESRRVLGAVAVDHDRAVERDALREKETLDLGLVDAAQPGRREDRRAWDVAAACLALEAPAVVGGDRADIDDGQARVGQAPVELVGRDGPRGRSQDLIRRGHRFASSRV